MDTKKQNTEMGTMLTLVVLAGTLLFDWTKGVQGAICLLLLTLLFPKALTPITWIWFKLAAVLEALFSKVVLTVIYIGVVIPVAYARRLFSGADRLQLRQFKKGTSSVFQDKNRVYTPDELDKQY